MGGAEFTRIRLLHSPFTATKEQRYSMQRMAAHSTTVPTNTSSTVDRMPTVRKIDTGLLIDTYGSFRGHSQWIQLGFPTQEPEAILNNFNGYEDAKKKGTNISLQKGLLVTDLHMVRH